ncbi:MAG: hypothetical protein ACPGJS_03435 [Flammeovirgaceae bacterium]
MQKRILLFMALSTFCHQYVYGNGDGKTTQFQGQILTQLSKSEFLHKAGKWVSFHLKSQEEATIDRTLGYIVATCTRKVFIEFSGVPVPMMLHYTLELKNRNGEVTYLIYDISYESIPDDGYHPNVIHVDHWKGLKKAGVSPSISSKYRLKTIVEVGEVIGHISSYLGTKS